MSTPGQVKGRATGRGWAYTMATLGVLVSVAANVAHSYVPPNAPAAAPPGWAADYEPPVGAVLWATFWPIALLGAIEMIARVAWPGGRRWKLLRWAGLGLVATVSAIVSYRHMSGLLRWYHEDPVTVVIGPLAVDGLMVMAAGALIATSVRRAPKETTSAPARVSLVKDPVIRLARQLGLPADTPLSTIIEHERGQAKLAGTFDTLSTIGARVKDLEHAVVDFAARPEPDPHERPVTVVDLERERERLATMVSTQISATLAQWREPVRRDPSKGAEPPKTSKPSAEMTAETRGWEAKRAQIAEAERAVREALAAGGTVSAADVGLQFGRSESWGRDILKRVRAENSNGKAAVG